MIAQFHEMLLATNALPEERRDEEDDQFLVELARLLIGTGIDDLPTACVAGAFPGQEGAAIEEAVCLMD